jgi:hypothetical protein
LRGWAANPTEWRAAPTPSCKWEGRRAAPPRPLPSAGVAAGFGEPKVSLAAAGWE